MDKKSGAVTLCALLLAGEAVPLASHMENAPGAEVIFPSCAEYRHNPHLPESDGAAQLLELNIPSIEVSATTSRIIRPLFPPNK